MGLASRLSLGVVAEDAEQAAGRCVGRDDGNFADIDAEADEGGGLRHETALPNATRPSLSSWILLVVGLINGCIYAAGAFGFHVLLTLLFSSLSSNQDKLYLIELC